MDLNDEKTRHLFRTERIKKGLTLTDLEEEGISTSTISNYQRGTQKLSDEKIRRLFEKLSIQLQEIPSLIQQQETDEKHHMTLLQLELKAITSEMDCGNAKQALMKLKAIELPTGHPYAANIEYLKGNYYYKKKNWSKSIRHFQLATKYYDDKPTLDCIDIKAASLYKLGIIQFRENQLLKALDYVDKGLIFLKDNHHENSCYKYYLLLSKTIYLERLERIKEAEETLRIMWSALNEIDTVIQLNMYDLQATILKKQGFYKKAIEYANTGIEMARREDNYDRCFELWTNLGSCYKDAGQFDLAKKCFQTASALNEKIQRKVLNASNDFELGVLYLKEGEITSAETKLEEALRGLKGENEDQKLSEILFALGKCYFARGKDEQAVKMCEKALDLAKKHSFLKQIHDIALEFAQYYESKDTVKYQRYLQFFYQTSIQLTRGENDMTLIENRISYDADPPHG